MLKLLFSLETKERLRHKKFENRQVRVKFQLLKEYSSTIRSVLFFFYPQWIILGEKKKKQPRKCSQNFVETVTNRDTNKEKRSYEFSCKMQISVLEVSTMRH